VLVRPLDPAGHVEGSIPIYFEYYPHTGPGPAAEAIVATEGGPGFPATESRDEYLALFQPLRSNHDVLIMDNRGTGRSGAVDCKRLQNAQTLTQESIAECGRSLGAAAPLYSTTLAADDLAAVLDELGIQRVSLYGDSYGTYFAQVFALRHPQKLRLLILDGAYPLEGPNYAWYPHYAPAMREKFNLACARDHVCESIPGSSIDHIRPALSLLRARPFEATVRYGSGGSIRFTAGAKALAIVMFGGSPAYATIRELDAAARAFSGGDRVPLLRLMAETLSSVDSRDPTHSPLKFSAGLAAAVSCQDPAQIFDMNLPPGRRVAARDPAPDTYAPFTFDEYRRMPLDYTFIDECLRWPAPAPGTARLPLVSGPFSYADIPVLVISGELDNMTSVADGEAAASHYRNAHHVVISNSLHVNALPHARSDCAATLARRFIETLTTGDESCASAVPPVRLVPRFARSMSELEPARALTGNRGSTFVLRVVTAALLTAEDVIVRADSNGFGGGFGLRGGSFDAAPASTPSGYRITLRDVRWTEDLGVSGRIDSAGRGGTVHADLVLHGAQVEGGTLRLQWNEGEGSALAQAQGQVGGQKIVAEAPAP
jgi:pimeloyl-ACP methyl ester carboxylesterase